LISFSNTDSIENEAKLMIDIAIAKGWNLLEIEVDGPDDFIKEVKKQIVEKIEEQNKKERINLNNSEEIYRPTSLLDNYIFDNKSKIFEAEKINDINFLKENLEANIVLEFAKQKYNINLDDFEVVDGNKINNKTNRQKPKSIIDFFTKEIGIPVGEATQICKDLISKQLIKNDRDLKHEERIEELTQQYEDISNKDIVDEQIEMNQNREDNHHARKRKNR
jgi:hypothetical protein